MKKPVLLIMAAGMGSRYGGLKQIDPIGPSGEIIIDYSIYSARAAGFERVVCLIKHSIEDDFKEIMNRGAAKYIDVDYAFQEIPDIPAGYSVPEDREKPWGTGQAVLACRDAVGDNPFLIINADDYYGHDVYKTMYDYLCTAEDKKKYDYSMAGYKMENTISENGTVTRGICKSRCGRLSGIAETSGIGWHGKKMGYDDPTAAEGWTEIKKGTLCSMNMFGFTPSIFVELEKRFPIALDKILRENPLKGEFFIPEVVSDIVADGLGSVKVLPCQDQWFGVTYKEDKPLVITSMQKKIEQGIYPSKLWG